MALVCERWGTKVGRDVHRNVYLCWAEKSRGCYQCVCVRIEDGGGRAGRVCMYIKAREITEQCLTAGTAQSYACEHAKIYRIYIRSQVLPPRAAQHARHRMLCLDSH